MRVALVPSSLAALDQLDCDLLVLGSYEGERPPRGLTGLLDWRLNGWVSRLLLQARFAGRPSELLLFPCGHRVGPRRALLVGLGPEAELGEARLSDLLDFVWAAVGRMDSRSIAMPVLGVESSTVPRRRYLPLLLSAAERQLGARVAPRLTVLAPNDDLRLLQSGLEPGRGAISGTKRG